MVAAAHGNATLPGSRFDLFREPQRSDPYPFFEHLRQEAPVFFAEDIGYWVVSRYQDVKQVLRDHENYSAQNTITPIHPLCEAARQALADGGWNLVPALGNADRPQHTKTRRSVVKAFSPRRIAALEPYVSAMLNGAVDRFQQEGKADLMAELLFDLPAQVILKLLGFPDEQAPAIKEGAKNRILFVWGRPADDEQTRLAAGLASFFSLCRELVDERLVRPADDLTSELLRVRAGDDETLSLDLIASILFAFFTAGHETTSSLLGNSIIQLLRHRQAWERIVDNPALILGAVQEILRYDSSVISWRRKAKREMEIAGVRVPANAELLLLLGAANHDEEVFADPERLDIERRNAGRHLSFGTGVHRCLGATLAEMEARLTLEALSRRLPGMRLAAGQRFDYLPNISFHGPRAVHVEWPAAGPGRMPGGNRDGTPA
ncbi:MAG: cytochrome P450 [Gammaproteobacteria bacterium]|nr:cytochrome P450 [Gammaproteobacteria bacterium]